MQIPGHTLLENNQRMHTNAMKKPKGLLALNVDLVNNGYGDELSFQLDSTYRQDGLSIGFDYLRLEGSTVGGRGELFPSVLTDRQLVGQGAFSTVHRALWHQDDDDNKTTEVAVKEFHLLDSSPQRRKMLIQELKTLARVKGQALVQLYGAFLTGDTVTMVLEFMNRGSLDALICRQQQPLPQATIAPIAYQILVGLDTLHQKRILHRDLKPANVVLNQDGCVKLCDFGLATLGDQSLSTTVLGTTKYMAPERLLAQPYGRLADIWSFGLLLVQCVTGAPPFADVSSMVDLLVVVQEEDVILRLIAVQDDLHPGFVEMIHGSLQVSAGKSLLYSGAMSTISSKPCN